MVCDSAGNLYIASASYGDVYRLSGGIIRRILAGGSSLLVDCPGDIVTGGPNSALGVGVVPTKWLC